MNAPDSPYDRFLRLCAALEAQRPDGENWRAYEALKRDFAAQVPDASAEQYDAAIAAICRATGC